MPFFSATSGRRARGPLAAEPWWQDQADDDKDDNKQIVPLAVQRMVLIKPRLHQGRERSRIILHLVMPSS